LLYAVFSFLSTYNSISLNFILISSILNPSILITHCHFHINPLKNQYLISNPIFFTLNLPKIIDQKTSLFKFSKIFKQIFITYEKLICPESFKNNLLHKLILLLQISKTISLNLTFILLSPIIIFFLITSIIIISNSFSNDFYLTFINLFS